jgi:thymidylate synthase (FAD)
MAMEIVKLISKQVGTSGGFINVVDVMPRLVEQGSLLRCDQAIVDAARVSYSSGTTRKNTDEGLVRYLFKNKHTSPFEMVQFKFHVRAPIFVIRQWQRHRMATYNEISGRYSVIDEKFWKPERFRKQSRTNKQGSSEEPLDQLVNEQLLSDYQTNLDSCYKLYERMIASGVAREMARTVLPLSTYTEMYVKTDLHNLLRFIKLRSDNHAQQEIREYSIALEQILEEYCPITMEAYREFGF